MLRNRYLIAVLGVLLLLVAFYNVRFFLQRRGPDRQAAEVSQPASAARTAGRTAAAGKAADYRPAWNRDPFWYPDGRRQQVYAGPRMRTPADERGVRLEGTTIKENKGYALINGRVYAVGDRVAGEQITAIDDRSVTLRGAGGARTLHILKRPAGKE